MFQSGELLLGGKIRDGKCVLGLPTKWPSVKAMDGGDMSPEQGWREVATCGPWVLPGVEPLELPPCIFPLALPRSSALLKHT